MLKKALWSVEGCTCAGYKRRQPGESDIWRRSHLGLLARSAEHDQGRITPPTESTHSTLFRFWPLCTCNICHYRRTEWNSSAVDDLHRPDENSLAWRNILFLWLEMKLESWCNRYSHEDLPMWTWIRTCEQQISLRLIEIFPKMTFFSQKCTFSHENYIQSCDFFIFFTLRLDFRLVKWKTAHETNTSLPKMWFYTMWRVSKDCGINIMRLCFVASEHTCAFLVMLSMFSGWWCLPHRHFDLLKTKDD